jgi:hypothetical protein
MKTRITLWIAVALAAFCFMGCFSTPKKLIPVQYSFAEAGSRTATITFVQAEKTGVRLVDCDGIARPTPSEGTYWEHDNLFPAGRPLNLRVYIYWNKDQFGERRRGIFICPPLEAGKEYKLWFKGGLKGGSLILTYSNISAITYSSKGQPQFEIVHEQVIPPPPK